jgi:hypothetical protein
MLRTFLMMVGFVSATVVTMNGFAMECASYEQIQGKLRSKYGEQKIFSGFTDTEDKQAANVIYEFWANPERGNWSLIANKLIIFQYNGNTIHENCVFIVNSGKRHHLTSTRHQDLDIDAEKTDSSASADEPTDTTPLYNCVPRDRHAQALKNRHDEIPVLQALAEDKALIEIYGSSDSWTITRVKAREVRNLMTGAPLTDTSTGQEIHQLCSSPAFSGKSWGLYQISEQPI